MPALAGLDVVVAIRCVKQLVFAHLGQISINRLTCSPKVFLGHLFLFFGRLLLPFRLDTETVRPVTLHFSFCTFRLSRVALLSNQ